MQREVLDALERLYVLEVLEVLKVWEILEVPRLYIQRMTYSYSVQRRDCVLYTEERVSLCYL